MQNSIDTAIIPAAGLGIRARDFFPDLPKGFIVTDGATLIERSVTLLEAHGIRRIVLVAGYRADAYREFAKSHPSVEIVENEEYAVTGSMASVACALERVNTDFLLIESDLYYEPRALSELLADERPDVVLMSGPTGATDEYWVEAPDGLLRNLSPDPAKLDSVAGEFVGITRVSAALGSLMLSIYKECSDSRKRLAMNYEAGALCAAAARHEIAVRLISDLLWGEIDCEAQFHHLQERIAKARAGRQAEPRLGPPRADDAG